MSTTLEDARKRLNKAVKAENRLTSRDILQLSMEVDRHMIYEQKALLDRLLKKTLSSNGKV